MTAETTSIVITGLALRVPGATTPQELWRLLLDGEDRTAPVSAARRELTGVADWDDVIGEMDGIELFDAALFGIDDDEARSMDPQHRVAMEVAHEAMAQAGMLESGATGARRYSVHMAMLPSDHFAKVCLHMATHGAESVHPRTLMNNMNSGLAARVSHQYNLTGPVMSVDTACSSFLTGMVQGINAILHEGCLGAVVGGVNLFSTPYLTALCNRGGIITPKTFTQVFDEKADGTLLGEGAVVCVLEREDIARRGNRRILGRILGSAINNDGSSLNIMAPNPRGQAQAIRDCYGAGIDHTQIGYIEAHGTGTRIGDPIEINALSQVYRRKDFRELGVGIGSVKSNLGHLLGAAGGAGLAKLLLSLQHGMMAPTLHLETVNPLLQLEETPFDVVAEPREWPRREGAPRVGAITSLGLGGTNVHLVVGEAEPPTPPSTLPASVLCLSAATEAALEQHIARAQQALQDGTHPYDLAMTLARYRPALPWRAVVRLQEAASEHLAVHRMHREVPVKRVLLDEDAMAPEDAEFLRGVLLDRIRPVGERAPADNELVVSFDAPSTVDGGTGSPRQPTPYATACELFLRGCAIDWQQFFPEETGTLTDLGPYPFDHRPYWLAP